MNKQILGVTFAALCGAAAFGVPASAQQTTTTQSAPASQVDANGHVKAQHAVPPLDSRQCIRDTGSHSPPPKGQCLPVAGSSYSARDIRRTGATDIGHALQMLDPSVTVHGH